MPVPGVTGTLAGVRPGSGHLAGRPGARGRWEPGASCWIRATLRSELEFIFAFSHSVSQTFQPRLPKCLSSDF